MYVALSDGATLPIDPALDQIQPTDLGRNRDQPAPLGETTITDDWEITALEMVRGEAAWSMAHAVNQFNNPQGMQRLLETLEPSPPKKK